VRSWQLARLGIGLALGTALTCAAAGGAAVGADPHDIPITVQVTGTPTVPSTSNGSARGRSGVGSGTSDASSAVEVEAAPAPGASLPAGTETLGGVLAVGGLSTSYTPSGNPLVGTVHVQMTVQNLSSEMIEPTVEFWLTNALGGRLSQQEMQTLGSIAPGELRVAQADLTGAGQWSAVDAHTTLTPPERIDGVKLGPVTRDRWLFAPPWFVLVALALGAAVLGAWRWSARAPKARAAAGAAA